MKSRQNSHPHVLLVVPAVAERVGGIPMLGRSLMRMLATKAREDKLTFSVLSLGGPDDADETARLQQWVGDRLRCFEGRRFSFCRATLCRMISLATVVVFTHLGLASLSTAIPRPLRPRTVTWIHGREVWLPLAWRHRAGLLRNELIVSNSEFTAKRARDANPWLPPVACCHLGLLDEREMVPEPSPTHRTASRRDILIVGRMVADEPGKGHRELIRAMSSVLEQVPDARLMVAGTGSAVPELKALAQRHHVAQAVVFRGFVSKPELDRLYQNAAVFAMPSRQDGFGLVYLDAMSYGIPCIASNADGGQEVVLDDRTGYHVPVDDPQTLSAVLVQLLQDDQLRSRLGQAGKQLVQNYFTETHFHERFWNLLSQKVL